MKLIIGWNELMMIECMKHKDEVSGWTEWMKWQNEKFE